MAPRFRARRCPGSLTRLKRLSPNKRTLGYYGIIAASLAVAIVSGWTALASQIDDYAYDWMFRLFPPAATKPHSIILAIDDATFGAMGGVREYRSMLAKALELLAQAHPKVVGIDLVLADKEDASEDDRLERAMQGTKNLVLVAHLAGQRWENPLDRFGRWSAGIGHDTADENSHDGVTRQIPLEKRTANMRHWALALEAFRQARGVTILESPEDLQVGNELIPAARTADGNRTLRILFRQEPIPQVSFQELSTKPELAARFTGQVVFVGVTSFSATPDRAKTPYGLMMPGVEAHAQLFETLQAGRFLKSAGNVTTPGLCLLAGAPAAFIFLLLFGLPSDLSALLLLMGALIAP